MLAVHLFGGGLYVRAGNFVDGREIDEEIERIRAQIAELRTERMELEAALTDLLSQRASLAQIDHQSVAVRNAPTVTGRYLGEGFDDQRLDTLFLTMPISWKGTLAQYVGRLHRRHAAKTEVLVVDYVDELVPVLARMAAKRRTGYRALGYTVV
jgi:superfamily II DNA or RNA helicase